MSFFIAGTGSSLPDTEIHNNLFEKFLDTSDKWITTRTGISDRRIIDGEGLNSLALNAAKKALVSAKVKADELDLIICATLGGDYVMPSTACMIQKGLGAKCKAFDLNAACTGFLYALDASEAYFKADLANNILIVSAEQMSKFLDFSDRTTCVLFGDGAAAAVLKKGSSLKYISVCAEGDEKNLYLKSDRNYIPFFQNASLKKKEYMQMNGQEIFKFAVSTVTSSIKDAIKKCGVQPKYYLLHQANGRIIDMVKDALHEPNGSFVCNYNKYGNTSCASIPLLLDELNREGKLQKGDILLLAAFGAGLTYGTAVIEWQA